MNKKNNGVMKRLLKDCCKENETLKQELADTKKEIAEIKKTVKIYLELLYNNSFDIESNMSFVSIERKLKALCEVKDNE